MKKDYIYIYTHTYLNNLAVQLKLIQCVNLLYLNFIKNSSKNQTKKKKNPSIKIHSFVSSDLHFLMKAPYHIKFIFN